MAHFIFKDTITGSHAEKQKNDNPETLASINDIDRNNPWQSRIVSWHDLGMAWAGNTINTSIFRHHGVITYEGRQTTAFYINATTLRIAQRNLATEEIRTYDLAGRYNLWDSHNCINLGADRDGFLHMSYDLHASRLRYRRSKVPNDISAWTDDLPMTGFAEDKVTYPTFILPHHGLPLTLLYRDGVHDKGTARMKTYDENTLTWKDHTRPILSGAEQKPWTSNAYWNNPAIGSNGSLHLSFVWRTHSIGREALVNNINICYARSFDNGVNWETSRGIPFQLPITQVNAEVIHPVSPGSNLMNQCSMALDSKNRPHIVFYADDLEGIPQYQHLWHDGYSWKNEEFSTRTKRFALKGYGTLQIPISRPEILIDHKDRVFALFRADFTGNCMAACRLSAPDYVAERKNDSNIQLVWNRAIGYAEPVIDRVRWQRENILTMLVQHNRQPEGDTAGNAAYEPVYLIDVLLE
ncbi:MAG: hypothetical protein HGA70_01240 [Chlorobiaceae bacterium]|nr:hypothetical protein [Chlorobiaceae bacterium]